MNEFATKQKVNSYIRPPLVANSVNESAGRLRGSQTFDAKNEKP